MHLVSRRTFLETSAAVGGGLLLGFRLPPLAPLQQNGPFVPNAFVRIDRDGRVTLIMHKVEMGQGTYTSMPMLLAEELEVDLSQVQLEHAPPDDARYAEPLFGVQETGGSTSVRGNWEPLRRAGATARSLLVAAAAQTWKVDPGSCHAAEGKVASVNDAKAKGIKGVQQVVRLDDAVAVVADHMWAAKQGLAALDIRWDEGPNAKLSTADIVQQLAAASEKAGVVARNEGDASKALAGAVRKVEAVYEVPFLAHATMEPVNCTVHVRPDGCDIWGGTQVPTFTRIAGSSIMDRVINQLFPKTLRVMRAAGLHQLVAMVKGLDVDAVEGAAEPPYTLPNIRVEYVRQEPPGVPTAFWRGVGPTHNIFVVESFMDELAAATQQDPFQYRRALLDQRPRAKAVPELAALQAGWG